MTYLDGSELSGVRRDAFVVLFGTPHLLIKKTDSPGYRVVPCQVTPDGLLRASTPTPARSHQDVDAEALRDALRAP